MAEKERRRKRFDRSVKVRSEGLYAISSWREMGFLAMPRLLLILGLLVLPLTLDMYWQRVLCTAGIYALLALSFDFLAEYVGLVCLGGAMFIGFGGYTSGVLNAYFEWSPFVTIPIATLGGAVMSTLVLIPCLRLRGIYFAIVSFMLPLFSVYIIIALGLFGSTEGISALDTLPNIWVEQYVVIGAIILALFAIRRLVNEDIGLIFRGIKDNDQAVRASGISITAYRIKAVFIA
ncbi:MAG TPA: branched-chain amino acid ABC transporter permease, partial [Desulfobacteraceae bacterium]|nr:branched-chain amino acid ABC transporter permease [Desulfobacteraceae bacterium]